MNAVAVSQSQNENQRICEIAPLLTRYFIYVSTDRKLDVDENLRKNSFSHTTH